MVITRDRLADLRRTLAHLAAAPGRPEILVLDNGSADGTVEEVRREHPEVHLVDLGRNVGAAARNIGVAMAPTEAVAFADDDSWWRGDARVRAASLLADHPEVGLVAGAVVLGSDGVPDPINASLGRSPLGRRLGLPGPDVLGFAACAAVVRRQAFLEAGGFHPGFGVGGEETLVALRMRERGWHCVHDPSLVAEHHPSPVRDRPARRASLIRNELWTEWCARPAAAAAARSVAVVGGAALRRADRAGVAAAFGGAASILADRSVIDQPTLDEWEWTGRKR